MVMNNNRHKVIHHCQQFHLSRVILFQAKIKLPR